MIPGIPRQAAFFNKPLSGKTTCMRIKPFVLIIILLAVSPSFYGQTTFAYDSAWKKIDGLIQKRGLPRSALTEVNRVYAAAKKDQREDQWIKAAIYRIQLTEVSEDEPGFRLTAWDSAMNAAPPRVKAILQSAEAAALMDYGRQQRYRRRAQATVTGDSSSDVSTWPGEKIDSLIEYLYLASLSEKTALKLTSLNGYEVILTKGNSRRLRPTLFDLLLFRALDFFKAADPFLSSADFAAENNAGLFATAAAFNHTAFSKSGSSDKKSVAIALYQEIMLFHERDADASALVDADIDRLTFAYANSTLPEKDSLYLDALARITNAFPKLPAAAEAGFLQASWYAQRAGSYDPVRDSSHRYDLVKAKSIAERFAFLADLSEGKTNSAELIAGIIRPVLRIETEKVNLPDQAFRVLLTYKNTKNIYCRIIRIDEPTYASLTENVYDDANWRKLVHFPADRKISFSLPQTGDFQQHRVELPIEALPAGQYALLTSADSGFSRNSSLSVNYFFQSRLAFINRGNDYYVVDRGSGKPIQGVTVKTRHRSYTNSNPAKSWVQDGRFVTDVLGHVSMKRNGSDSYGRVYDFSLGKDRLSSSGEYLYSYSEDDTDDGTDNDEEEARADYEKKWLRNSLFVDRAIYRPGQTVFVKSLMMTRDFKNKAYRVVANQEFKLYLVDANQQHIDSISYRTTAFGSFSTSFRLPQAALTGLFSINDSLTGAEVSFSLEEYKRPKFYVKLDTPAGRLRLNDSATFTGSAISFAGNSIDGASVSYRVYREARFPYPWYFRHTPSSQQQELTQGTVKTNQKGEFAISFRAASDPTVQLSAKPTFTYRVAVMVTDINGETREGAGSVAISAQSFELNSPLPRESDLSTDSLMRFPVTTKDANGVFKPQTINVSIYRLRMPDRLIRARYWDQPDQHLMDSESYIRKFPFDEYADESLKSSWVMGEKVADQTAVTRNDAVFPLALKNASGLKGWFLAVFSARDINGDSITDKRWIQLGAERALKPLYPVYNTSQAEYKRGEPGESVAIHTGSSAGPVYVIRARVPLTDSLTHISTLTINHEINETSLRITESDRGGFAVQDAFVINNRWYSSSHIVEVPWSNKQLEIGFSTWKNKLLPGAAETWKLQISGNRKEKVNAEILTAMYDASLDEFKPGEWNLPGLYETISPRYAWNGISLFAKQEGFEKPATEEIPAGYDKRYDALIGIPSGNPMFMRSLRPAASPVSPESRAAGAGLSEVVVMGYSSRKKRSAEPAQEEESRNDSVVAAAPGITQPGQTPVIRKNFNETAFFLPDLHTDAEGNVTFSFTMPEALTRWKWSVFAHTKDLAFGLGEKSVITQKDLMLMPNMPRFLRQGDSLQIPVKISNLSANVLSGKVKIDWRDAGDSSERNTAFGNRIPEQPFSIPAGESRTYFFAAAVAKGQEQPVYYRLTATTEGATQLSDGEEGILPVLSNRKLVTETLPLRLNRETTKTFDFDKLLRSDSNKTLQHHSLTVEYTTRPAWYAVQALPYLMEFPYECAEQTFDRYYANALGQEIVGHVPGMAGIMAAWKSGDSSALQSNLQKNQELKTVLLKETPWVVEGQSETAQKQNLAKLLDKENLQAEMKKALARLQGMQSATGGFPWFAGGRDDRYITQYIITGIGHLLKLKAMPAADQKSYGDIIKKALIFLDAEIGRDYDRRPRKPTGADIGPIQIQYLYMRSFFQTIDINGKNFPAVNYYRRQARQHWADQNMYLRGMIALFMNRNGDRQTAWNIVKSLRENAISNDKDGTYWKRSGSGYYWQESQVETQSLLIEAFAELGENGETDNMKWWLLQQKQSTHWSSTKSTADACYALLMNGSEWIGNEQGVTIRLGAEAVTGSSEKAEAGTGYFKRVFPAEKVIPDMGHVVVTTNAVSGRPVPSFGAVYWQYFEDLDKISSDGTSLGITKTLFVQKNTEKGVVGQALAPGAALHPGDKLLLRFIINTDRDLSYVQLQDQRAACLEPVDALSGYQWKGDISYYQAPGDESTSFFFDFLPKGTHVVEYPVYVTTNGIFSAGISTLQTMYAPEFAGHSAGSRLQVTEK